MINRLLVHASALLAATAFVGGCQPRSNPAIAACEARAAHLQPGQKLQDGNDIGPAMQACMAEHGYRFNLFKDTCREGIDAETQPGCYARAKR